MTCTSGYDEDVRRASRRLRDLKPKVIYDSLEIAEACERELRATVGGSRQRAYPCPRSRSGHHHLTRDLHRDGNHDPR